MNGLRIEWIQASFFIEMLVITWILMIPMKKREHFWQQGVLLVLAGSVIAAMDTNSNIKFILETAMIGFIAYRVYVISWRKATYTAVCAYAVQHLTYTVGMIEKCIRGILFHVPHAPTDSEPDINLKMFLTVALVYGTCYLFFVRKKRGKGEFDISVRQTIGFSVGVFFVVLVLSRMVQSYANNEYYGLELVCHFYSLICCLFILILDDGIFRRIQDENELSLVKYLWLKRQEQYAVAKENMNAINLKCHELKQQITGIQEMQVSEQLKDSLEDLKDSIQIYDAVVKTGNEVLDVVLTEKNFYCQANHITMACIVDGAKMDFMETMDVYALFTGLFEDTFYSIKMLEEPDKKQIALSVWEKNGLLMIQLENYFEDSKEAQEVREEGIDYSIKSVKEIVKKYDGCMTIHKEHALVIKRISMPIP